MVPLNKEYQGGYVRTKNLEVMIQALRKKLLNKQQCRALSALMLRSDMKVKISLDTIINHDPTKRRMTEPTIQLEIDYVIKLLKDLQPERELTHKISKRFLNTMVAGNMTVAQFATGLYYFLRRMPQRGRRSALLKGERYGRFKVREAARAIGRAACTVSAALRWLRSRGVIARLPRPLKEIIVNGTLYVDGWKMSISSSASEEKRKQTLLERYRNFQKTRTTPAENQHNIIDRTLPVNASSIPNKSTGLWSTVSRVSWRQFGVALKAN